MFTNLTAARIQHRGNLGEVKQARTPSTRDPLDPQEPSAARRFLSRVTALGRSSGSSAGFLSGSHELFVGHDQEQLTRLSGFFTVIDVPAGRMLGGQGHIAREFVTILDGEVGVTIDGIPHAVLDDGAHFGAVPLLDDVPGAEHSASFTVMTPTRIAVANAAEFHALISDFPLVAQRVRAMTDVRRAYLAGLAHVDAAEQQVPVAPAIQTYPVHDIQHSHHV
jgi:CRP-like cAMP-binding protein